MPLTVGQTLPGGFLVAVADEHALMLERPTVLERRDALRRFGFLLIPLVFAVVAVAGTWDAEPGLKLAAWPVAALLIAVVALGLLSVVRSVRRARHGVRLAVDARTRTVSGVAEAKGSLDDYRTALISARFDEVSGAQLSVFRGAGGAWALLRVALVLDRGQSLQGPELSVPDPDWEAEARRLTDVTAELARRIGCKATQSIVEPR